MAKAFQIQGSLSSPGSLPDPFEDTPSPRDRCFCEFPWDVMDICAFVSRMSAPKCFYSRLSGLVRSFRPWTPARMTAPGCARDICPEKLLFRHRNELFALLPRKKNPPPKPPTPIKRVFRAVRANCPPSFL